MDTEQRRRRKRRKKKEQETRTEGATAGRRGRELGGTAAAQRVASCGRVGSDMRAVLALKGSWRSRGAEEGAGARGARAEEEDPRGRARALQLGARASAGARIAPERFKLRRKKVFF